MENIHQYIEIGLACLSLCNIFICAIIAFVKASKSKKKELLKNALLVLMEDAEKFKNYSAEEKKQYVFTRAKEFINENNIKFSDSLLSALIERQIEFSNNVNVGKKK